MSGCSTPIELRGFPGGAGIKSPPAEAGHAGDVGWEDGLDKEVATHSSIPARKIPLGCKESDITDDEYVLYFSLKKI